MSNSTKDKILVGALKLFADKGFNAVSIREIAQTCDVNIAAVNYHFKNKDSLYLEIIKESLHRTEEELEAIYKNSSNISTADYTLKIFDYFIKNGEGLRTHFKLIVSTNTVHEKVAKDFPRFSGPPGAKYLRECIINEVKTSVIKDIDWAVRSIFTQVIHRAIILTNTTINQSLSLQGINREVFEQDIKRLTNLIISSLK